MMQNEDFTSKDQLELLITERLAERHSKLLRMSEWEKIHKSSVVRNTILLMAACVTLAIVMAPFVVSERSPLEELNITYLPTEYRAASAEMEEIAELIEDLRYDEALEVVDEQIDEIRDYMFQIDVLAEEMNVDERDYEVDMCKAAISELRWVRVYILTSMKQYKAARKELNTYLKDKNHCEHRGDAERLREALKRKDDFFAQRWVTFYESLLK